MNSMTESPTVRHINDLCAGLPRTALQVNTNKRFQVIQIFTGQYVRLRDTERHTNRVDWADWVNADAWRVL